MFEYGRKIINSKYIISISIVMTLILIILMVGCTVKQGDSDSKQEITVFAASSLTESLQEIILLFKKENPEVKVKLNFDSTSRLRLQIEQGVEGDVFFSANKGHYDALKEEGYITYGQALLYNSMVVIVPRNNPANIEKVEDLQNKCKLVLALRQVPAGDYARVIIHSLSTKMGAGFENKVLNNIVSEENNVKQVVNKVVMGEADAAFVYSSDVTQSVKQKVKVLEITPEHNVRAEYFIGKLKKEDQNQYIEEFYSFLIGKEAQKIYHKYGFNSIK